MGPGAEAHRPFFRPPGRKNKPDTQFRSARVSRTCSFCLEPSRRAICRRKRLRDGPGTGSRPPQRRRKDLRPPSGSASRRISGKALSLQPCYVVVASLLGLIARVTHLLTLTRLRLDLLELGVGFRPGALGVFTHPCLFPDWPGSCTNALTATDPASSRAQAQPAPPSSPLALWRKCWRKAAGDHWSSTTPSRTCVGSCPRRRATRLPL
jgi:hypothetical protein